MSGSSFGGTCHKCGYSIICYSDYKPHSTVSGECLDCGFCYHTVDGQMTLEEVNELRVNMELEPLEVLKKQKE